MDIKKELMCSLENGFIDDNIVSLNEYNSTLLSNDITKNEKVLTSLIYELKHCDEFYFNVAFVTNSGINILINIFKELEEKNIKGQIITSEYLFFTEPQALRRLVSFKNITVKFCNANEKSHSKGYIFKHGEQATVIIGSSNLTQSALCQNKEWNIKLKLHEQGKIFKQVMSEFENSFSNAQTLDDNLIDNYEKVYNLNKELKKTFVLSNIPTIISPNEMQLKALSSLRQLRKEKKNKALLISATGTGKTYLSAFDAKQFTPSTLLFVIHRENIAKKSMQSYQKIFGHDKTFGLLTGNEKNYNADFVFTTIQTLSKDDVLHRFAPTHFDYIVIDEVHHCASNTYQKILNYFKPKFMLGMSATPERTDGYNIFEHFDHNIAYEIRLNEALKNDMLCPFHYFGIADITVNGELLNENDNFNMLITDERVKNIINASKFYGYSGERLKGVIFCSRVEETKMLSEKLNMYGYKTVALNSNCSEYEREQAIKLLESDALEHLDYILTVDIFNEGIDIPSINQVIMLRPTKSAIVFVQQLGRGLRKCENKEYVVVIDFIGNYQNNYLLPIALYGDNSYNKENLRRLIHTNSSLIPGCSTVTFDRIVEDKIYEAINNKNFLLKTDLLHEYNLLKYKLGKIPTMMDFVQHGQIDPIAFANYKNTSYYDFVKTIEKEIFHLNNTLCFNFLEFCTKEIITTKRLEDSYIFNELLTKGNVIFQDITKNIYEKYGYVVTDSTIFSAINSINGSFIKKADKEKYEIYDIVDVTDNEAHLTKEFTSFIDNYNLRNYLLDLASYGIHKFDSIYSKDKYINNLILYEKYTRRQILKILNWKRDIPSLNIGGYIYNENENVFPMFITYNKREDIKYDNTFTNKYTTFVISKPNRTMHSSEIVRQIEMNDNKMTIPLFIKKSDSEGAEFYFIGNINPIEFKEIMLENKNNKVQKAIKVTYNLDIPIEDTLFDYITN